LWIYLYKRVKVRYQKPIQLTGYFVTSLIGILIIATLAIGGIRGDFQKSTRPINLLDASRYVKNPSQADFVLNTPFAIIRTMFSNNFEKLTLVDQKTIDSLIVPYKEYHNFPKSKPNVVVMILESNGREYFGSFNKQFNIPNYVGYTPFIDSLAQKSLIFTNAYANGYKSIHAMSSVLA
jgi:hypothetical protein